MARKKHLINVHTSTGTTAPTGASLYLGEIAVQHTTNDPGLWIKMGTTEASTTYEKFIGKTEITNMVSATSGLVNDLSAVTLTGVTMNNSPVNVTNHVANLGTVITAETQLSTATTGTGNVVGSIGVSNHKITTTMFSAASADQISKLSGATTAINQTLTTVSGAAHTKITNLSAGTISLVASSAASVYSSAVSYVNSAISGLDSSTAVTNGKYITGIAIADGKISGITEATLPSAPAITATTAGTGNVFTAVSTTGHSMTFTKGMTAAAKSDLDSLSAATTAHTANNDIHVTTTQKTNWTNGANSGASAYTMVQNLSAVTITGVTMNGSPVSVTNKVANLGTVITAETQLSTAVTGNGNVFSSIQVANHKITMGRDVTALTGVSTPNNDNYISVSVASNSAITVGEKNAVVADKTALSNVTATGSLVDAKAVKDYVADELTSAVSYKGATGATPATAEVGDLYIASSNIAIPAAKSATGAAVTAETGDFIIARTTGTWDVIEKNLDGAITGNLTANTLTIGNGLHTAKSLANGSNGQVLTVGSNGPQWTTGVLTDTATTLDGHYTPTGNTTGGTTATTSGSAVKGIVYDEKGHITSVVTGSVLTAQTSITTANGSTGNAAAAVVTGITTGGTAGHQLTLNKTNKIFSAATSDSALTTISAITSWSAQTTILGPTYSYSGLPYVFSSTSLADAYSALTKELIDDELVTAAALNDLNQRVVEISGMVGDNTELIDYIQENEEVVAGALNNLNNRVSVVETHMTGDYIPITGYMLASGATEEELTLRETDTVNEALGKLQKQSLDNEEAIAAGLNDLNERVTANAQAIAKNTGVTALSGAVRSIQNELNNFESNYSYYTGNTIKYELSAATMSLSSATQSLSAAVQSISAKTSGILTINANGVEQGRYSPSANTTIDLQIVQDVTGADVLLTGYELATGTTEEELAIVATDTVNEAFGKIQKQNYDNEAVIAGALNDLDERVLALEAGGGTEEIWNEIEDQELIVAAALNDLNSRIIDLSGDSSYQSSLIQVLSGLVADISGNTGGGGGGTDTACTETGHYSPSTTASTLGTTAASTTSFIKGINIDSKKHAISVSTGTVVTAQTQLSTATTGNGNVLTNITVNNHQITKNFGMTIPSWATASTKPSYTASEVGALPTGTTLDNVADGTTRKLSNYATTGTVNTLNNTVTAHTGNSTVHITSAERTAWNGKANTSDITITGLTVGGTNATVTNKVAAVPTASTSTFGVVKVPAQTTSFLTNTSGTIGVAVGTGANQVAKGSDFAAVSAATTVHTANANIHVPTTGGTNGDVLMLVNGAPKWVTPSTITYSSSAPTGGNDGDIWIQTS